jgi:soluble P-type ATPase
MIEIKIPGYGELHLENLVLDYNGTIAFDGHLIEGIGEALNALSDHLDLHVLTADTFGTVRSKLSSIPCRLHVIPRRNEVRAKLEYVKALKPVHTVCIGNGRNDRLMLKETVLGIAVVQAEGAAVEALLSADIVCNNIIHALELLIFPSRLIATLRS